MPDAQLDFAALQPVNHLGPPWWKGSAPIGRSGRYARLWIYKA